MEEGAIRLSLLVPEAPRQEPRRIRSVTASWRPQDTGSKRHGSSFSDEGEAMGCL